MADAAQARPAAAAAEPAAKKEKPNVYGAVAEFFGTLVIAFFTAMVGGNSGRAAFGIDSMGPIVLGFVYIGLLSAFTHVSGGYFNPALVLLGKLMKRVSAIDMLLFIAMQFAGAFVGVLIAGEIATIDLYNAVGWSYDESEAIFVEIVFAAILFHVYILTVHPHREKVVSGGNSFFSVAFGFTFMGMSAAAANISGGVFNPAVGLALQCVNDGGSLWYIYTWAPLVASILAFVVGAFTATRMPNTNRPFFHFGGAMLFEFFHTGALVCVTALIFRPYFPSASATTGISNDWAPLIIGLFWGGQVYAGYRISGGHVNPAISLAVYLCQKHFLARGSPGQDKIKDSKVAKWWKLLAYWTAQIVGGIVGGLVAVRMQPTDVTGTTVEFYPQAGTHDNFQEFVFEFVFVVAMVWTYLCTARTATTRGNNFFGVACALSFVAAAFSYGNSPVSMNPATGLGLILAADADSVTEPGNKAWIYILAPLLASFVGTLVYRVTNEDQFVEEAAEGSRESGRQLAGVQAPLNELVGLFYFNLTLAATNGSANASATALAGACMLATVIYCSAHTSGGHQNPAVSFGAWLIKGLTLEKLIIYVVMQVIGGILGAVLGKYLTDQVVTLQPKQNISNGDWLCFLAEFLFTALLVMTALGAHTANNQERYKRNKYSGTHVHGLAVGFTVVAGGYAIGQFSGAGMNPGVTTGLMVRNGSEDVLGKLWLYLLAQFLGGAAAAAIMAVCYEKDVRGAAARNFDALRGVAGEFLGSFYVFLVTSLVLAQVNTASLTGAAALYAFLAIASVYLVVTYQYRGASGAHFNPAVTVAAVASNAVDMGFGGLCAYVVAQILGAIAGGLIANVFTTDSFAPWVTDNDDSFRALVAEFICVFLICTVFLNVMYSKAQRGNQFFGWAMGLTYAACSAAVFGLSRAGLNPAVTGLVAVNGTSAVADDLYIYWVGPLLGALLAAGLFFFTSNASPALAEN